VGRLRVAQTRREKRRVSATRATPVLLARPIFKRSERSDHLIEFILRVGNKLGDLADL